MSTYTQVLSNAIETLNEAIALKQKQIQSINEYDYSSYKLNLAREKILLTNIVRSKKFFDDYQDNLLKQSQNKPILELEQDIEDLNEFTKSYENYQNITSDLKSTIKSEQAYLNKLKNLFTENV